MDNLLSTIYNDFLDLDDFNKITLIVLLIVAIVVPPVFLIWSKKYSIVHRAYKLRKYIEFNNVMDAIKLIEKCPETINVQFHSDGYTPFLVACKKGDKLLVNLMLKLGADLEIRTNRGETGFYLACFNLIESKEYKDASVIQALYHAGADIDGRTNFGYTPLHLAAAFGHVPLGDWLITKNANHLIKPYPHLLAAQLGHKRVGNMLEKLIIRKQCAR